MFCGEVYHDVCENTGGYRERYKRVNKKTYRKTTCCHEQVPLAVFPNSTANRTLPPPTHLWERPYARTDPMLCKGAVNWTEVFVHLNPIKHTQKKQKQKTIKWTWDMRVSRQQFDIFTDMKMKRWGTWASLIVVICWSNTKNAGLLKSIYSSQ